MFSLRMQTKTKWPGISQVTRKNLTASSKPAGRAVLAQLRSALRSQAPVSRRKTKSHDAQRAEYGTLKKQIGKISTLRVRASFKREGWMWRFKMGRGHAFWLHFLESGVKGRNYPKNKFFSTTTRRFQARFQSAQVAALRQAIKRSLAEARTTTI